MTILVTGVAGFIASHLARFLLNNTTSNVIGVDKISYCSSMKHLTDILEHERFQFEKLDLTDEEMVKALFKKHNPQIIFHLAAYSHVDHSFREPLIFTANNTLGTHILLETARLHKVKRFIHMSTDEVYGTAHLISDETSMLDPTNPYSASKAGAEIMVRAYWHSYKMPVIVVRANNVYGTHQYPEKVIPLFVKRLMEDKPCILHGSGKQTRSFLHVDDLCQGLLLLMNKGVLGEVYNIGSDNEISITELGKRIIQIVRKEKEEESKWLVCGEDRVYNDLHYRIDDSKIKRLGFKPTVDFTTGLREVVEWYMVHQDYW